MRILKEANQDVPDFLQSGGGGGGGASSGGGKSFGGKDFRQTSAPQAHGTHLLISHQKLFSCYVPNFEILVPHIFKIGGDAEDEEW